MFFVISGFLITSIVKRQLDADAFSLRAFYVARVRRLAPELFAALVLVMAAGTFTAVPARPDRAHAAGPPLAALLVHTVRRTEGIGLIFVDASSVASFT